MHATFYSWLKNQKCRNGPVGDLARDVSQDYAAGCLQENSFGSIKQHMIYVHHAEDKALSALDLAYEEFRQRKD